MIIKALFETDEAATRSLPSAFPGLSFEAGRIYTGFGVNHWPLELTSRPVERTPRGIQSQGHYDHRAFGCWFESDPIVGLGCWPSARQRVVESCASTLATTGF